MATTRDTGRPVLPQGFVLCGPPNLGRARGPAPMCETARQANLHLGMVHMRCCGVRPGGVGTGGLGTLTWRTREAGPRCQSPGGDVVRSVSGGQRAWPSPGSGPGAVAWAWGCGVSGSGTAWGLGPGLWGWWVRGSGPGGKAGAVGLAGHGLEAGVVGLRLVVEWRRWPPACGGLGGGLCTGRGS